MDLSPAVRNWAQALRLAQASPLRVLVLPEQPLFPAVSVWPVVQPPNLPTAGPVSLVPQQRPIARAALLEWLGPACLPQPVRFGAQPPP